MTIYYSDEEPQDAVEGDMWIPGLGKETSPGTPSLSPIVPQLWEGELQKALEIPEWICNLPTSPRKPLTFRQKIRRQWYRLLAWWPLQWKDRSDGEWD